MWIPVKACNKGSDAAGRGVELIGVDGNDEDSGADDGAAKGTLVMFCVFRSFFYELKKDK